MVDGNEINQTVGETMNANEMTFGVEFEVICPSLSDVAGGYHAGRAAEGLPPGWKIERDASLTRGGVEIVSPVLNGADGIRQIIAVCEFLQEHGATVDDSCGYHVHIGTDGLTSGGLQRAVCAVANHEEGIFSVCRTMTRRTNHFCRHTRNDRQARSFVRGAGLEAMCGRYRVLNVTNLLSGRQKTVEFRAFAGVTTAEAAVGYVRICVGLVERAENENCKRGFSRRYPKSMTTCVAAAKRLLAHIDWKAGSGCGRVGVEAMPFELTRKAMITQARWQDLEREAVGVTPEAYREASGG